MFNLKPLLRYDIWVLMGYHIIYISILIIILGYIILTKRRSNQVILEALIEAIPVNSTLPLKTIAVNADLDYFTAKRWMEILILIQGFPEIIEEKIGEQTGYRRKTLAGRPRKS